MQHSIDVVHDRWMPTLFAANDWPTNDDTSTIAAIIDLRMIWLPWLEYPHIGIVKHYRCTNPQRGLAVLKPTRPFKSKLFGKTYAPGNLGRICSIHFLFLSASDVPVIPP